MPSAEAAVRLLARVAMECTGFYQRPVKGLMADIGKNFPRWAYIVKKC